MHGFGVYRRSSGVSRAMLFVVAGAAFGAMFSSRPPEDPFNPSFFIANQGSAALEGIK